MNAGRDLDALVAEKVMDLLTTTGGSVDRPNYYARIDSNSAWENTPHYSTDIAAAFTVIEAMRQRWSSDDNPCNFWTFKDLGKTHIGITGWRVEVEFYPDHDAPVVEVEAVSQSLPHAICLAALRALGVEVPS